LKRTFLAIALSVAVAPGHATAQDTGGGLALTFGAGLVASSGVYAGQDDEITPFPVIAASFGDWIVDARGVRYAAVATERTRVDIGLAYGFAPDLPDTPFFAGLDRDAHVELVATVTRRFDGFDIGAEVAGDVSSVHDGVRADLSVGRAVPLGGMRVEGRLGVEYLDADFAAHRFGVRPGEAAAGRPAYAPGRTVTPRLELSAALPFENGTTLVGFVEYRRLPDAIADSPLVAVRDQTSVGLMLMRRF
jgi:outer membrane protein